MDQGRWLPAFPTTSPVPLQCGLPFGFLSVKRIVRSLLGPIFDVPFQSPRILQYEHRQHQDERLRGDRDGWFHGEISHSCFLNSLHTVESWDLSPPPVGGDRARIP